MPFNLDEMSDEEIEQFILQAAQFSPMDFAANEYGSGPGFMDANSNPYARSGNRMKHATDVLRMAGVYLPDLLDLHPEPEQPTAPKVVQNDVAEAYRGNPVLASAIELIENGMDPFQAQAIVQQQVEAGAYGDPGVAAGMLPQKPVRDQFGDVSDETEIDWSSVGTVLTDVASKNQEFNREQDRFAHEQAAYDDFHSPSTAWQDSGFQGVDDYVQAVGGYREGQLLSADSYSDSAIKRASGAGGQNDPLMQAYQQILGEQTPLNEGTPLTETDTWAALGDPNDYERASQIVLPEPKGRPGDESRGGGGKRWGTPGPDGAGTLAPPPAQRRVFSPRDAMWNDRVSTKGEQVKSQMQAHQTPSKNDQNQRRAMEAVLSTLMGAPVN